MTSRPSCWTASVRHERIRSPSTSTVHAPWSQPFFVPVRCRWSRKASSRLTRGSSVRVRRVPLTRRLRVSGPDSRLLIVIAIEANRGMPHGPNPFRDRQDSPLPVILGQRLTLTSSTPVGCNKADTSARLGGQFPATYTIFHAGHTGAGCRNRRPWNSLCRAAGDGQYVQLPQQIKDDGLAVRRHVEGHPRTLVRVKFDSPG